MNDVARLVTEREGLKKILTIGDVKEVLKCLRQVMYLDCDAKACAEKYLRIKPKGKK